MNCDHAHTVRLRLGQNDIRSEVGKGESVATSAEHANLVRDHFAPRAVLAIRMQA